jgi:hypothetical protein
MAGAPPPVVTPITTSTPPPVASVSTAQDAPWYADFKDPELKGYAELNKWTGPEAAARDAREAQKLIGVPKDELVRVPKDFNAAKPEDMAALYDRLGRPKTPADYKLETPAGDTGEFATAIAPILHKHGITAIQAKGLNADWNNLMETMTAASVEARAQAQQAELDGLKKEWAGKTYGEREELGRRAMREFGEALGKDDDERKASLTAIEDAIGTAKLLKLFASIGEKQGEHGFVDGDTGSKGTFGMTPDAARVKMKELESDREWAKRYSNGGLAENAQYDNLLRIANSTA